ncbi:DUF6110 family protein [uncultured Finegoldia sp.]|uniref:DUF6110 family protein n=1 Tax=uncultured Finegoldia sp. TaxID=328009 RepID=UPI00262F752C|nr:DUF6110 family protein [uncultured Finegoldia sp.]
MLNKKILSLGAGILAGAIGGKILNSKLAKKAAVSTVVGGLKVKESIDKTVESIRVSAEDVIAEAKDIKEKEDLEEAKKKDDLDIEKVAEEAEEKEEENK